MIRNGPKRTIFSSGGLGLLQMVYTRASQTPGDVLVKTLAPKGVDCEIPPLEMRIKPFFIRV